MKHQRIEKAAEPSQRHSVAATLKAAKAAMRKVDVIDVGEVESPEPRVPPTPEQKAKATYEKVVGQASSGEYRRLPLFETLFKQTDSIGEAGLAALRYYRAAHEDAAASPTRCALNDEGRGGGVPLCIPFSIAGMMLEDLHGGTLVDMLERGVPAKTLPTLRAVALDDKSFSQIAIERFGGRKQNWMVTKERVMKDGKPLVIKKPVTKDGKPHPSTQEAGKVGPQFRTVHREKLAPISRTHRRWIADEFAVALAALIQAHAPHVSTVARPSAPRPSRPVDDAEAALVAMVEAEPLRAVDPAYLDDAGRMRSFSEIAALIRAKVFDADDEPTDERA